MRLSGILNLGVGYNLKWTQKNRSTLRNILQYSMLFEIVSRPKVESIHEQYIPVR